MKVAIWLFWRASHIAICVMAWGHVTHDVQGFVIMGLLFNNFCRDAAEAALELKESREISS